MKQITCPFCGDTYPDFDVAHVCSKGPYAIKLGPYAPKLKPKMNERIKELAEQADIVFWEISGDVDWRQANRENLEKFAELIVQACVTQCAMMGVSNWDNDDISWAVEGCIDNIRSHFGESDENL